MGGLPTSLACSCSTRSLLLPRRLFVLLLSPCSACVPLPVQKVPQAASPLHGTICDNKSRAAPRGDDASVDRYNRCPCLVDCVLRTCPAAHAVVVACCPSMAGRAGPH